MSSIKNWLLKNNNKKPEEVLSTSEAIEVSDDDIVVNKAKPCNRSEKSGRDKVLAGKSSDSDNEPELEDNIPAIRSQS